MQQIASVLRSRLHLVHLARFAAAAVVLSACFSAQAACEKEVVFKPGASSAVLRGSVAGYGYCDYTFRARKNQQLTVSVNSPRLESHLVEPVEEMMADDQPFVLPQDGAYVLRVGASRAAARKKTAIAYRLNIAIE